MNEKVTVLGLLVTGLLYVGLRKRPRRRARRHLWRSVWGRFGARTYHGTVYRIRVRSPHLGRPVTGYIGKTVRPVETRIREHLQGSPTTPAKPWADTVVGWDVLWTGKCSAAGLALREVWRIRTRWPLYNVQHNRPNPRRIPPHRAVIQRAARDRRGAVMRREY